MIKSFSIIYTFLTLLIFLQLFLGDASMAIGVVLEFVILWILGAIILAFTLDRVEMEKSDYIYLFLGSPFPAWIILLVISFL